MASSSTLTIRFLSPTAGMDDTPSPAMHDFIPSLLSPTNSLPSLRRTLEEDDEEGSRFDIWNSIQEEKRKAPLNDQGREGFDVWGSIASQDAFRRSESETLPVQYVHPLVRRSSSCLSEKSLEICTESLGSETGSDGFSSTVETRCVFGPQGDEGERNGTSFSPAFGRTLGVHGFDAERSPRAPAAITKSKQGPRSFPPPIPSLSPAVDGGSLRMQSRRENGRLVLEAVSVPSQKNFQARRENGRLMLEITSHDDDSNLDPDSSMEEQEEADQVGEGRANPSGDDVAAREGATAAASDEEGIEWIIRKEAETTVEIAPSSLRIDRIGKLTIPKIAIVMNEPDKVREVVIFERGINGGEVGINPMAGTVMNPQNVYEYFWRTKQGSDAVREDTRQQQQPQPPPLTLKSYTNTKEYVISRRNNGETATKDRREVRILWREDNGRNTVEDCWVSVMKKGGGSRRPLVVLGPRCIATS